MFLEGIGGTESRLGSPYCVTSGRARDPSHGLLPHAVHLHLGLAAPPPSRRPTSASTVPSRLRSPSSTSLLALLPPTPPAARQPPMAEVMPPPPVPPPPPTYSMAGGNKSPNPRNPKLDLGAPLPPPALIHRPAWWRHPRRLLALHAPPTAFATTPASSPPHFQSKLPIGLRHRARLTASIVGQAATGHATGRAGEFPSGLLPTDKDNVTIGAIQLSLERHY
jgi:hypothetical protein